jgi:DNA polymerase-3 subunit gamma/tau
VALALYRKYRPATFAEVVGQEHVTDPLRNALASGRINHAYLFSGPRGCGKTSSARILARSLNCVQGPTPDPCGECNSCVALAPNGSGSIDVVELDAASHGGVDDARELRDRAFYAPAEARYRVFIIDEAHMVTAQGFNALLKVVEEPPEHLIFIFATTEPDKVLTTIRSRTHHYPFRLIPPMSMRELVERNCEAEGIAVEPAVFPLVIRAGGGSARDTQSVLDQLLSGAGPDGVTYAMAVALLGVTDVALLDDMVDGLAAGDGQAVFGTVERLVEAGHDPRRFAADLLERLRDLMLLRSVPDAGSRGLVNATDDELEKLAAEAERIGPGTLTRYAEIMHAGLTEMRGATAPRLLLELLCSRMLLPAAVGAGSSEAGEAEQDAALLHRLERLERRLAGAAEHAPAQPPAPQPPAPQSAAPQSVAPQPTAAQRSQQAAQPEPARQPKPPEPAPEPEAERVSQAAPGGEPGRAAAPNAQPQHQEPEPEPAPEPQQPEDSGALDAAGLRRVWPDIRAAVRGGSRSVEAMLSSATIQSVSGNSVVLTHTAGALVRRLSEQRNIEVLANALHSVLGGDWQVTWEQAGSGSGPAQGAQGGRQPQQQPPPQPPQQKASPQADGQQEQQREPAPESSKPAEPAPEEPARRGGYAKRAKARVAEQDAVPPPPEPPDDEPPPPEGDDEESMLAEAAQPPGPDEEANHRSPEDDALDLLAQHLGARRIDGH